MFLAAKPLSFLVVKILAAVSLMYLEWTQNKTLSG